jgi:hypothetical protein
MTGLETARLATVLPAGNQLASPGRIHARNEEAPMKGDRVEIVVDTGGTVQTFEIVATRAGRRIEVTTARGVVEVTEVTRGGTPVRTGRFMANRIIALVEHPAREGDTTVDVVTRRRIGAREGGGRRAERAPGLFDDGADTDASAT